MLRTLLLSLLCLLLLGPQAAFPVASGQAPPVTEKNLPLNRTTFHFFSPEDIAANYRSPKIVRVGYFDQHGVFEGEGEQLSGYAVALLTAVSRYTGWEYEWVKIRFDELAQRLDDGSIDLSCGISYTPERARLFDFSKLRAGYENTCLHVASTSDMHYMDLEAFNGMRIGFFADSLQYEVMRHFAAQNGFSFESLFFEESSEMVQALADGRIDGYVDGVLQGKGTKVVATISTDPFFFVTRRNNRIFPDIEACRKAFEKGELDVYLWPYPAAPLQDDPPEDGLLLPTRAMYPMSLGISPHASPFVTSVLDKVITSTTTATLDALLLSAAPDSLSDIIHRFLRRNFVEALYGLGLLLVLIVLLVMRHNRRRLAELRAAALTDPVTLGPNRGRFLMDAAKILQKDKRRHYLCTVNIRKLKLINRACGLRTGDSLIRLCNREFALRSRQGELAAYSGSGQYLLLWRCPDDAAFTQRMEELFSIADMARRLYQRPVSFSCGVYVIRNDAEAGEGEPGGGQDVNESERFVSRYLLYAETAEASIASGGYRSQFLIYNELIGARQLKANDIENRMVKALEQGEFTVFMQPQVCLADRRLHGAEALIRWQIPDGKMVYPDEFIPLFEQNGFIRELDLFVLDTVCAWIRRRLDEGKKVPPISINQSKALFFQDNYVKTVLGIAERHNVPARLLHVEVTESMAWLDEEAFIRTLEALRRAGIGLSLDDFGKGYSSLAMLHSFGFDTIKLDRAFLAPGQEKQRSVWIIISSLVDMARRLGIEILCEGVETEDQLQKLLVSHCKYGQGYLFSPPMNLDAFDAYVDAHELERK